MKTEDWTMYFFICFWDICLLLLVLHLKKILDFSEYNFRLFIFCLVWFKKWTIIDIGKKYLVILSIINYFQSL